LLACEVVAPSSALGKLHIVTFAVISRDAAQVFFTPSQEFDMSQIHWLNAINGRFTNPADWGGGVVPGASDDAILDAVGSAFTVTSGANETVDSLQLTANATLSLIGKTFAATTGTGTGANAGIILVGAGATLVAGGMLTVTDGTHTARITLKGNSLGSAFVASSDGSGGTDVIRPEDGGRVRRAPHLCRRHGGVRTTCRQRAVRRRTLDHANADPGVIPHGAALGFVGE
jgi:hypothetical protein